MVWVVQRKAPRSVVYWQRLLVVIDVLQAPVLHPACAAPRPQDLLTWLPRHFCRRRRASRAGEVFLETGGGAGVVEDGVGRWFSRTGFGWTLNMVSLSACALGWPYHHRAAEEQQQAARLQSGGDSERIGVWRC